LLGKRTQSLGFLPVGVGHETIRQTLFLDQPRVLRKPLVAAILAGEKAAGEGKERKQPEPVTLHRWDQLLLRRANDEAVFVLAGNKLVETAGLGGPPCVDYLPGPQVGAAR